MRYSGCSQGTGLSSAVGSSVLQGCPGGIPRGVLLLLLLTSRSVDTLLLLLLTSRGVDTSPQEKSPPSHPGKDTGGEPGLQWGLGRTDRKEEQRRKSGEQNGNIRKSGEQNGNIRRSRVKARRAVF